MSKEEPTVCILVATRNHLEDWFVNQLNAEFPGSPRIVTKHVSDVALARNVTLSKAVSLFADKVDCYVMVDDDIELPARGHVRELVKRATHSQEPCSALYVDVHRRPCATRFGDRYLTGLGCLALPGKVLLNLVRSSIQCEEIRGEAIFALTQSAPVEVEGKWRFLSEDYYFTHRLGGVRLCEDIRVGHRKTQVLYPQ